MSDRVKLRAHQELIEKELTITAPAEGRKVVTARVFCAMGKTWGWQYAAVQLRRANLIDAVLCGVPRINLGRQGELDYRHLATMLGPNHFPSMVFRGGPDELQYSQGERALISTYQSMVMADVNGANPFLEFVKKHRTLLVADEAQWLGVSDDPQDTDKGTRAAQLFAQMIEASKLTLLLTPCPYRSDGQRIVGASYQTGPDGRDYLKADVEALFRLGIARGYLSRFEAFLSDGSGVFQNIITNEEETRCFSDMDSGLRALLRRPEIWQGLVDEGIKHLRELQELHGAVRVDVQGTRRECKLCAVVAAPDQETAKAIVRYLQSCYSRMSVLLAVESWRLSEDDLRRFKDGTHDVIVTVGKCHVGYDHKPIKVVVNLNATRWFGWLDNFIGRGLRIIPDYEDIQARYVGPADPRHLEWIEGLRKDQDLGIADRETGSPRGPREEKAVIERITAAATGSRLLLETEEQYDLSPLQLANLEDFTAEFGLRALPVRRVLRLMAEMKRDLNAPRAAVDPTPAPFVAGAMDLRTQEEIEREVRKELQQAVVECDKIVMQSDPTWSYGWSMSQCHRHFGWTTAVGRSVQELEEARVWVESVWKPACREMVLNAAADGLVELPPGWFDAEAPIPEE